MSGLLLDCVIEKIKLIMYKETISLSIDNFIYLKIIN